MSSPSQGLRSRLRHVPRVDLGTPRGPPSPAVSLLRLSEPPPGHLLTSAPGSPCRHSPAHPDNSGPTPAQGSDSALSHLPRASSACHLSTRGSARGGFCWLWHHAPDPLVGGSSRPHHVRESDNLTPSDAHAVCSRLWLAPAAFPGVLGAPHSAFLTLSSLKAQLTSCPFPGDSVSAPAPSSPRATRPASNRPGAVRLLSLAGPPWPCREPRPTLLGAPGGLATALRRAG